MTPNLVSMTSSEPYLGNDHLHVGNGKGLIISNIAHSKIHSPKYTFILSNILHVLDIKKPMLSVQKQILKNNIFLKKFISFYFMLRISWQRKCFFLVRVEMIYMFCLSRLQRRCLKFSHLHVSFFQLMSSIIDLGIPVHAFCIFWWKIKRYHIRQINLILIVLRNL